MADKYKVGIELDREDNDKGYSKSKCRWVTHEVNMQNSSAAKSNKKVPV